MAAEALTRQATPPRRQERQGLVRPVGLVGRVGLVVVLSAAAALGQESRWEPVLVEDFEKGAPGSPVGTPWAQRHPKRQIVLTDRVAASGKQCATFRYEVSADGSLDQEAGLFNMEAPIPRPRNDPLGTWRISAAMRFHPIAWTAASFRVRGDAGRAPFAVVNSMNLLFVGGQVNMPVWNVAKPDQWYRVQIVLREAEGVFDLEVGEAGGEYRNVFLNVPVEPGSLPIRYASFGYCGALVRYGQGRVSFLDDVRIERMAKSP